MAAAASTPRTGPWTSSRVASGLANVINSADRARATIKAREDEYEVIQDEPRVEIEYSDADDEPVEDDLPLEAVVLRPSRRWAEKHMKTHDEWNQELLSNEATRQRVQEGEGEFSEGDGRFRLIPKSTKLQQLDLDKHADRTVNRRTCRFFFRARGYCKYGAWCTLSHSKGPRPMDDRHQHQAVDRRGAGPETEQWAEQRSAKRQRVHEPEHW